jgi:hypothetical protein
MRTAQQTLDDQFLEMRWRCLSLAADLDRIQSAAGGPEILQSDARLKKLHLALLALVDSSGDRAAQVQMIFSDMTKEPSR